MLAIDATAVRLFVHVLAATIWVGGQLTLAGLVPALRRLGPDAPRAVARQFNRIAWPAFGVLVASGIWNLLEADITSVDSEYQTTVAVKLGFVAMSGIGAAAHSRGRTAKAFAVGGAAAAIGAVGALFLGVVLRA
jgi:putative copper export protein